MSHPKKRQRIVRDAVEAANNNMNWACTIDRLGTDELAHIFGFLSPIDIMNARLNNKMIEAAKKTIVPVL